MKPIRTLRRAITWAGLGLTGGALVVTTRHLLSTPQPLESGLSGEGRIARRREGDIYYNIAGPQNTEPVVLLHDFYPGASNYEFRRIFQRLAGDHRLYAPDWLGFGMSERPALAYTGEFYAHLLAGFLRDTVGAPATVLADGLAGNVAVRAASDEPGLFSRLVLVSPRPLAGTQPAPTATQVAARAAQRTALGLVPYAALATRVGLRWELRRRAAYAGEGTATDDAVDHAYASAHQFGGHYAPLALLIGDLDLPMANVFALLETPVLVVAGELDSPQRRLQMEDLTLLNPHARMLTLRGAGEVVHEDQPDAFAERVSLWLKTTVGRVAPAPGDSTPEPAPDQLRSEMSTPEAPVPTTLAAMTAPLEPGEAHEEEGTIEPQSGPHPVPADARTPEERPAPQAQQEPADADKREEVIVLPEPSAARGEMVQGEGVAQTESATGPADAASTGADGGEDAEAATRDTAAQLADQEERVGLEMQRVDERIRAQTPDRVTGEASEASEAPAPTEAEAVPPHVAAEAERPERPSQAQRAAPRRGRDAPARAAPGAAGAPSQQTAREQTAREGEPGQPAGGARPNPPARPGASGQKRSGRKPKHSH